MRRRADRGCSSTASSASIPRSPNEDVMGTIPQALFLMNGPLVNNRIQARPGTVLGEILSTAPNDRAALGGLYLRVLSRQPTNRKSKSAAGTWRASATGPRRSKTSTGA